MPSRKTKNGEYKDIAHPICPDFREKLQNEILKAYSSADTAAATDEDED